MIFFADENSFNAAPFPTPPSQELNKKFDEFKSQEMTITKGGQKPTQNNPLNRARRFN